MTASARSGPPGPAGEGVPVGGADGQVLAKASATDFDTEWVDQTGGGGTGDVTQAELDAETAARAAADSALDTRVDALEVAPPAHTHPQSDITGLTAALAAKQDASTAATDAELAAHEADTTGVHGIADTSALVLTGDARLSDTRTPTDGSVTAAKVAGSLKPSGTAAAGTEALRALGTSASTAAAGNDSRLSDARTPTSHASSHASGGSDPVTIAESQVTGLTADLAAKADLASPALTGNPTAPTQTAGNNSTRLSTTAFVTDAVATEASARSSADALKAPLASPALTGTPTVPTAAQGTNTTQAASTAFVQTEIGLVVPKSLVDAKGDLVVGTADNTVARKAVGSDGAILGADSSQSDGLRWEDHALPPALVPLTGEYVGPIISGNQNQTGVNQEVWYVPVRLAAAKTYDRISIVTVTAAGTTGTARLGLYKGNTGRPGALVFDAGTVSIITTTGAKEITISQAVPRGFYFLAMLMEFTGTAPVFSGFANLQGGDQLQSAAGVGSVRSTFVATGQSGAFPSNAPTVALKAIGAMIQLRAA